MKDSPSYASWQIEVSFAHHQVTCSPNPLEIPADTIATITWVPAPGSDFTFLQFEWSNKNGFLSQDPIIHDQCVIAAVNNAGPKTDGCWSYLLKIQVGDHVYQQGAMDELEDGKPVIHNR
jgi:hypothetical protein